MRIVITGASGFVGQNLVTFLEANGTKADALSLRDSNWKQKIDPNAAAIIHLAGKAHDTSNTSAEEEYFKVNRDLTIQLFDLFLESDVRDFFYFSSVKAVADFVENTLYEDANPSPKTPYGKSKLEAEKYLLSKEIPTGKRLFIIRPCMIHGPGNKGNLNLLYKIVKKGIPWPLADFENKRSFLSISNLNYLIHKILMDINVTSGVYNFADDRAISTNELITIISQQLGKKTVLLRLPSGIIRSLAKVGDILPLPLNTERLTKLTENYVVSNNKIKEELNVQSLPMSAEDGLRLTIDSFT